MLLKAYQQRLFYTRQPWVSASLTGGSSPAMSGTKPSVYADTFLSQDETDFAAWKTWATGVMLIGEVDLLNALPERLKPTG